MAPKRLIYNIPVDLMDAYRGRQVIVRFYEPTRLVEEVSNRDLINLEYAQLLNLAADSGKLANWGLGLPIDLVMCEPEIELGRLYNHAKLLDKHPVRVTIPVQRGFANAVKIAASLSFEVKLTVFQPDREDLAEMLEVLEMFLHKKTFAQPVEFYQSLLLSFLNNDGQTVWDIQEEDPSQIRYITPEGVETISPRFLDARAMPGRSFDTFIEDFKLGLLAEHGECENCEFLTHCKGYFKWSKRNYTCARGIKNLFYRLKSAAGELKGDLANHAKSGGGN